MSNSAQKKANRVYIAEARKLRDMPAKTRKKKKKKRLLKRLKPQTRVKSAFRCVHCQIL